MLEEMQHETNGKLFVCFVDFKKAYDTVPRACLWEKLHHLGIPPSLLTSLKALYTDVPLCLRTAAGYSAPFPSLTGLKQGCPLSPTLFNLYIDDLETCILGSAGVDVPMLPDGPVPPLTYADDVALMSTSAAGLQRQLDALGRYAVQWKLTVNIGKTEVVVYKKGTPELAQRWSYGGQRLKVADRFNYLGCMTHAARRYGEAGDDRAAKARRAAHLIRRRAIELGIGNAETQLLLFDAVVRAGLEYIRIYMGQRLGHLSTWREKAGGGQA
jgi:hypothetical protein